MKYSRLWERLIEYVDKWASAREVPGGIEITLQRSPGVTQVVEVVVTPAEWNDYISIIFGTDNPRETPFKEKVLATTDATRYLVYDTYDFEPSKTRKLPKEVLPSGPGKWVPIHDTKEVVDRFTD